MTMATVFLAVLATSAPPESFNLVTIFEEQGAVRFLSAVDDCVEKHGPSATARVLASLLARDDGDHRELRAAVLHAIGRMGKTGQSLLPELITAINSTTFPVEYLDEYNPGDIPLWLAESLVRPDQAAPDEVGAALTFTFDLTKEKRLLPLLIQGTSHKNPHVRFWVVTALGDMGDTASPALALLIKLLKKEPAGDLTPDEARMQNKIRGAAAHALGQIGVEPERCVPLLTQMLEHRDTEIWRNAAMALGLFRKDAAPAIPALVEALARDDSPFLAVATGHVAAIALRNIGEPALPALIDALHSKQPNVRRRVAEAFWLVPTNSGAVDALVTAACDDPDREVRVSASAALRFPALNPEYAKKLLSALSDIVKDEDPGVRANAAWILGWMESRGHAWQSLFLVLLQDEDAGVRHAAVQSVPRLPPSSGLVPPLKRLLDDPAPSVRSSTRETLNRLREYNDEAEDEGLGLAPGGTG